MNCPKCMAEIIPVLLETTLGNNGADVIERRLRCPECKHKFIERARHVTVIRCRKCNQPIASIRGFGNVVIDIGAECDPCLEQGHNHEMIQMIEAGVYNEDVPK